MTQHFKRIGLFAKYNSRSIVDTFEKLISFLDKQGYELSIETESAELLLDKDKFTLVHKRELGKNCDLVIVVGGDGSILNAARALVQYHVPVVGVNRGRLGFLADILPENMEKELTPILQGTYLKENRFLLEVTLKRNDTTLAESTALNDVVLYSGNVARMTDFEVYINQDFMLRQFADGLIAATPTGSTAYALSAGGPIVYPALNAITLAPLCPHTLSSRPIVVDANSLIELKITDSNKISPKLSCDGQLHFDLLPGDRILIQKHAHELILIHPQNHNYFTVLREKLGWSKSQIKD